MKRKKYKLSLEKEAIRHLADHELSEVAVRGGGPGVLGSLDCTCNKTSCHPA